jgi:hypothetical protein
MKRLNTNGLDSIVRMSDSDYIPPVDPHKNEKKVTWNDLNNWNQGSIILLTVLGLFGGAINIVGFLIGFFWCGPECFRMAETYDKNPQWGYFYGFTFGIIGLIIYYLWAHWGYTND